MMDLMRVTKNTKNLCKKKKTGQCTWIYMYYQNYLRNMFDKSLDGWQIQFHGYLLSDHRSPQVLYIDSASFGIVSPTISHQSVNAMT